MGKKRSAVGRRESRRLRQHACLTAAAVVVIVVGVDVRPHIDESRERPTVPSDSGPRRVEPAVDGERMRRGEKVANDEDGNATGKPTEARPRRHSRGRRSGVTWAHHVSFLSLSDVAITCLDLPPRYPRIIKASREGEKGE